MENRERLNYLDIARGIAILFIVFGHLASGENIIVKWIYSFHVVFISPSALWFLPAFFIGETLMLGIIKFKSKVIKSFLVLVFFIIPYIVSLNNYNFIVLLLSRGLVACGFITIGYYAKNIIDNTSIIQSIVMLLLTFVLSQFNAIIDLYSLQLGNLTLYILNGVLASIGIIGISKTLNKHNYLEFCGTNTIIIMGTHQWMTRLIEINFDRSNLYISVIALVVIMIIEYPIIKFINNKMPCMLGKFNDKENFEIKVAID